MERRHAAALWGSGFYLFLCLGSLAEPAFSQVGTNEMNDYSGALGSGMGVFGREAWDRTNLDSTLMYLERKSDQARERREREERKRRLGEREIRNTPEQLFGFSPSRQFTPSYNRRYRP